MQNVPKIVRDRLQAAAPAVNHPDADLLTAFAERSLPEHERTVVLEHLARCGDCRDIVALALPEPSPCKRLSVHLPLDGLLGQLFAGDLSRPALSPSHRSGSCNFSDGQPQATASAPKQATRVEIAANEPKKEVDRFVAPADKDEKKEKLQAPATPAFADSVNGAVVADVEKKNAWHGEAIRHASPRPRVRLLARARPSADRYLRAGTFESIPAAKHHLRIRCLRRSHPRRSRSSRTSRISASLLGRRRST